MAFLSGVSSLTGQVRGFVDKKQTFIFERSEEGVRVLPSSSSNITDVFANAEKLAGYTIDLVKSRRLRQIPPGEREELRDLVDVAYRHIKIIAKQYKGEDAAAIKKLKAMALSAKIGGRVSFTTLLNPDYQSFVRFLEVNGLQHRIQALGYQLPEGARLSVEDFYTPIPWAVITKTTITESGQNKGFVFSFQGRELFRTDANYKLTDAYSYIGGKIVKYNPITSQDLRPYDKEAPQSGRFKIEIWTAVQDKKGEVPRIIGDHTYFVLVDEEGTRVGVGQYGRADDLNCYYFASVLGKKRGYVETPDRYLLLPKDSHYFKKIEIYIDKATHDRLLLQVTQDKAKTPDLVVSWLQDNCSTYAKNLLAPIGIKMETHMHILELFWRQLAPLSWIRFCDQCAAKLPDVVKKLLYFSPVIYLPTLLIGLVVRMLSLINYKRKKPDISLFDVIFRPWRVSVDHPFAVRQWQMTQPDIIDLRK